MNFDMSRFYAKAVQDFSDAIRPDGAIPDTAPFVGLNYCGIGWGMAHPLLQRELYRYYGDRRTIEAHYETTQTWMKYLAKRYPKFLVTDGLTDHEALVATPPEATVTLLYAHCAQICSELAGILGREKEQNSYQTLSSRILATYQKTFPDAPPTQTAISHALEYAKLDNKSAERAVDRLLADISAHKDQLTTGIAGTKFMLDALSRNGHAEAAYTLATQKTFPSWGWMLENGATTLWEHWEKEESTFSHNHPMFGSISAWFFHWLVGIQPAPDAVGFDKIHLRPQFVKSLPWAEATYKSPHGEIFLRWERKGNATGLDIRIPVGASATLYLPDGTTQALESGKHRLTVQN
jgi:alpha-L-rhamnosidase